MLDEWRVDGRRFHERHRDRHTVVLELHAQGVGVALDGVFGCGISSEKRRRTIGRNRTDVDDGASAPPEMTNGRAASVDNAPEIHIEQAPFVDERRFRQLSIHADAGVVNPRVEATELLDGQIRDPVNSVGICDIRDDMEGLAAAPANAAHDVQQVPLISRCEDDARTRIRRHFCGREANAARCAGNDDDLFGKRFELDVHTGTRAKLVPG